MEQKYFLKESLRLTIFAFLISTQLTAQNLVPNPGFESYAICPVGFSEFNGYVNSWVNPSTASPDYYNACANPYPAGVPANGTGYQESHSGNAYAGGYMTAGSYREFIQVQLTSVLTAGTIYTFKMYTVLHNKSKWATDDLGVYISSGAPTSSGTGFLNGNPVAQITNAAGNIITDSLNWTLITGNYTATGGEHYITIGHFKPNSVSNYVQVNYGSQGSYYYFDDVSLTPSSPLPVGLSSFKATPKSESILVQWTTESEINNNGFELQRGTDAENLTNIAWINGSGLSATLHSYCYDDANVVCNRIYYYRLKQCDTNGDVKYSDIISASLKTSKHFSTCHVHDGQLIIDMLHESDLTLYLINTEGQVLQTYKQHLVKGTNKINFNKLPGSRLNEINFARIIVEGESYTLKILPVIE